MVYLIETNQVFAGEEASSLSRLAGPVRGVATEDWPVYQGHPMQHFFTIDLRAVQIDLPAARDARLLVVFTMAFYELDPGMSDTIVMRWVSDDDLERIPESIPPNGYELIGEIHEEHYEKHDLVLEFVEEEDEPSYNNDFIGQTPAWPEEGKPDVSPKGAFILQITSDSFPMTIQSSTLYLFEEGAQIVHHEPPEEDEAMAVAWPETIASSREFVVEDANPESEAVQKWGGLPRGISEDDWPEDSYHLLTFEPSFWPEERPDGALAIAVFAPQEWEEEPEFQTVFVCADALDEAVEAPEGIAVLPERILTLRPFAKETSYYDLRLSSYEGPRLAWRSATQSEFEEGTFGFQLTHDLLTNAPSEGTLYFDSKYNTPPIWQPVRGTTMTHAQENLSTLEGLSGTLYEEDTESALAIGYRISLSSEHTISNDEIRSFAAALIEANNANDLDLELIIAGDSITDASEFSSTLILGQRLFQASAGDEPLAIDHLTVVDALASLPSLPDSYWKSLEESAQGVKTNRKPGSYLLSYGPLCSAALYIGHPIDASEQDEAVYDFELPQDMEQQPGDVGVDGIMLASVEFQEIKELTFDNKVHGKNLKKVEEFESPVYLLICSYD